MLNLLQFNRENRKKALEDSIKACILGFVNFVHYQEQKNEYAQKGKAKLISTGMYTRGYGLPFWTKESPSHIEGLS
jgi:hypothetical protein